MKPVPGFLVPVLRLAVFAACAAILPVAHADCDGQYFAPDDSDNARPLRRPHGEFLTMLRAANAGNAQASRSLAAAYEAGYLVSRCREKAQYWYVKAASAGDTVARRRADELQELARLASGPECIGAYCKESRDGSAHVAMFYAGRNGHYFAPLTINGVTVEGLIDTGASAIAISRETARKFGIDVLPGQPGTARTANGMIETTNVIVPSVTVSGITLQDVRVSIGITGDPLIGMTFLSRLHLQMGGGALSMSRGQ
ncbi:MAG TPA: TIGR02281 family clan AA aspartic protease [Noviherbaspirillum sp.]|nr:TIGR02281 family clan AA aspartic protease [Noviherbaspirillum sp.]